MRRITALCAVGLMALALVGCPSSTSTTQRQKVAQAAQTASIIVKDFQQGEITAHAQGLIPDADHKFIQKELKDVGEIGLTLDVCIRSTTTSAGIVVCANSATSALDQINTDGGLYLKSTQAKTDFQLAIIGTRTALAVIATLFGGN